MSVGTTAGLPLPRKNALVRYVVAAFLARGADAGAAVGFVLLAAARPTSIPPALAGAFLAAALTAPHVLGPLSARFLDRVEDQRKVLAAAAALYGAAVSAAALTLGSIPIAASIVLVCCAGFCGPLLTGGLSSTVTSLVAPGEKSQRRAQSWDALTYGIGGTLGPAAVALLSSLVSPLAAILSLAAAAFVSAGTTLTLPEQQHDRRASRRSPDRSGVMHALLHIGPLRRTTLLTMAAALPGGAVAVIAVAFAETTTGTASGGGLLVAVFGIGNLVGSLVLTLFPLRGEAERSLEIFTLLVAVAFATCGFATTYPVLLVLLGIAGSLNAPFFAATLAVRADYSPAEVRGRAFTAMAGFKIAASSAGTAIAGATIGLGASPLFIAGAIVVGLVLAITRTDRAVSNRPAPN